MFSHLIKKSTKSARMYQIKTIHIEGLRTLVSASNLHMSFAMKPLKASFAFLSLCLLGFFTLPSAEARSPLPCTAKKNADPVLISCAHFVKDLKHRYPSTEIQYFETTPDMAEDVFFRVYSHTQDSHGQVHSEILGEMNYDDYQFNHGNMSVNVNTAMNAFLTGQANVGLYKHIPSAELTATLSTEAMLFLFAMKMRGQVSFASKKIFGETFVKMLKDQKRSFRLVGSTLGFLTTVYIWWSFAHNTLKTFYRDFISAVGDFDGFTYKLFLNSLFSHVENCMSAERNCTLLEASVHNQTKIFAGMKDEKKAKSLLDSVENMGKGDSSEPLLKDESKVDAFFNSTNESSNEFPIRRRAMVVQDLDLLNNSLKAFFRPANSQLDEDIGFYQPFHVFGAPKFNLPAIPQF